MSIHRKRTAGRVCCTSLLLLALTFLIVCSSLPTPASAQFRNGKVVLRNAFAAMARRGVFRTYLLLFRASGFQPILANFIYNTPVTLMAPVDAAWRLLPLRIRRQLTGRKLIKLLEYHMILQLLPYAFLRYAKAAPFRTVLGQYMWKQKLPPFQVARGRVAFATVRFARPLAHAVILFPDVGGRGLYLMAVEGINRVLVPRGIFF